MYLKYFILTFFFKEGWVRFWFFLYETEHLGSRTHLDGGPFDLSPRCVGSGRTVALHPGEVIKGTRRFPEGDRARGALEGPMSVSEGPQPAGACPRASLHGGGSFLSHGPSPHPTPPRLLRRLMAPRTPGVYYAFNLRGALWGKPLS